MKLEGKVALITGVSSGIGLSIALEFLASGASVVGIYPQSDQPTEYARASLEELQGKFLAVECDVREEGQIDHAVMAALDVFGRIDVLINNAGIAKKTKMASTNLDDFDDVISVNLRGTFAVTRSVLRHLDEASYPESMINIASELAYLGREDNSAYCASKAGVIGLTRSWAREFATKIRVNAIAPGPTITRMCDPSCLSEKEMAVELDSPMGRMATPEEIAKTAVFLASDDALYYTGQTLGPNGGAVMY